MSALAELLSELYPDPDRVRFLLRKIGMNVSRVDMAGAPFYRWERALEETLKTSCLPSLVDAATELFPMRGADLRDAKENFLESHSRGIDIIVHRIWTDSKRTNVNLGFQNNSEVGREIVSTLMLSAAHRMRGVAGKVGQEPQSIGSIGRFVPRGLSRETLAFALSSQVNAEYTAFSVDLCCRHEERVLYANHFYAIPESACKLLLDVSCNLGSEADERYSSLWNGGESDVMQSPKAMSHDDLHRSVRYLPVSHVGVDLELINEHSLWELLNRIRIDATSKRLLLALVSIPDLTDYLLEYLLKQVDPTASMRLDATERYWACIAIGEIGTEEAVRGLERASSLDQNDFASKGAREALRMLRVSRTI